MSHNVPMCPTDCERGCNEHIARRVDVDLRERHGYHDLAHVPRRLAVAFPMFVFDPEVHPVGGDHPPCVAHDNVSEGIAEQGIWEPLQTIAALSALRADAPGMMIDIGSQLGWYTLLARSSGRSVVAVDVATEPMALMTRSLAANDWSADVALIRKALPFPPKFPVPADPIRLVKIDVEGREPEALDWLAPAFGRIDHMLVEMSPCFNDRYPAVLDRLSDAGFAAYRFPEKARPPWPFAGLRDLRSWRLTREEAHERLHWIDQEDWWFAREGASW